MSDGGSSRRTVPGRANRCFTWTGRSGAASRWPSRRGFGTEVLYEMLVYEFEAQAALDFEVDGLRFSLRLPLVPTVGRVIAGGDAEASRDS